MRSLKIFTPADYSQFNPIFPGKLGHPIHIARAMKAMFDKSTGWKSGDVIVMDNDASYHVHEHYKDIALTDSDWDLDRDTEVYDVTGNHKYDYSKSEL